MVCKEVSFGGVAGFSMTVHIDRQRIMHSERCFLSDGGWLITNVNDVVIEPLTRHLYRGGTEHGSFAPGGRRRGGGGGRVSL